MSPVPERELDRSPARFATGIRLIVAYKAVKAALGMLLALALAVVLLTGEAVRLHVLAEALRQHMVSAWSVRLADLLVTVTTDRHLVMTAVALALDGALTSIEGWSLWRGYTWGAWLVIGLTASLIPFEIRELTHGVRLGRLLVFAVNVIIVVYLIARVRREARARAHLKSSERGAEDDPGPPHRHEDRIPHPCRDGRAAPPPPAAPSRD